jgi:hypothetical protein
MKEGGNNKIDKKAYEQNTKKRSQMLSKHPLTLGAHQHDEHLHPKPFAKMMKRRNHN